MFQTNMGDGLSWVSDGGLLSDIMPLNRNRAMIRSYAASEAEEKKKL